MNTNPRPTATTQFPELNFTRSESSPVTFVRQSLLMTKRLLTIWSRDPLTMVQAVAYPAIMLVMLWMVIGITMEGFSNEPAAYRFAPLMSLVAAMVGSIAGVVLVIQERENGVLSRYWSLPIHRGADLAGRLMAEAVRIVLTTILILIVAFPLGFRLNSVTATFAFLSVPLMFGIGFATVATACALITTKQTLIAALQLFIMFGMFFSSGFVPLQAFPSWAQPFVENQPLSHAVEAMRAIALGEDFSSPLIRCAIWSGSLVVLFSVPAIVGYRRSAAG
ncbi:ABC transporter permease [Hoyosella subflava]|uniref:Transport permease protein n=1 Tax=Hoyosella subflava (strain DSM 45089 / JCM 17490 / NBRC 109087 / DQS3-9A1) TaxID=443218 RepID=F6EHX0_HOYSD|nr:ABC transporter permease [Hoyosella subflava]AEF38918.1 Putative ABC transporter permease protein [Hoyosella subflava DQS3-9A1]